MAERHRALFVFAFLLLPLNEAAKLRSISSRNEIVQRSVFSDTSARSSWSASRSELSITMRVKTKDETMAEMTVEKAYRSFMKMNLSTANRAVVRMIQDKIGGHKGKTDPNAPTGYAAVDTARIMLNTMMNEAIINKELESVKCDEFERKQLKVLRELEQDISYVNSEASGARAEILRAEELIHVLEEVKLPTSRKELKEHNEACDINIATLRQQLSVVMADIDIMKHILDMVCADFVTTPAPAFLQVDDSSMDNAGAIVKCVSCMTGHQLAWMRHSTIQPLLASLKSKVAKDYMQEHLIGEFDQTSPNKVRTVLLQEEELGQHIPGTDIEVPSLTSRFNVSAPKFANPGTCNEEMTGENSNTYRGCQTETVSGRDCMKWTSQTPHKHNTTPEAYPDAGLGDHNMCRNPNGEKTIWCYTTDANTEWEYCDPMVLLKAPTGVEEHECVEANMCKLSHPDCGKLRDRFLVIMAGIVDKKNELSTSLDDLENSCQRIRESYETSIKSMESELREEQTNLAISTKGMTENQQQSDLSNEQHGSLDMEYHDEMKTCCDNKNSFTAEICALEKIRGELFKLEGLDVFITDCEVSDWIDEECSVSCGGGEQTRTRTILQHPINGTQCPPLRIDRTCNLEGCPVDCVLNDWGGWSDCSAACGGGVMTRARGKKVEPENGGDACEEQEETRQCNGFACNEDCELGSWSDWGLCSKACSTGYQERTKPVTKEKRGLGHCDPPDSEDRLDFRKCNSHSCRSMIPPGRTLLECTGMIDLIIILDGSGSLGSYGWQESKRMVLKLIDSLVGGESGVNVGLILFSGPAKWRDWWECTQGTTNDHPDPEVCGVQWVKHLTPNVSQVESAAEDLAWPRRTTLTSLALAQAQSELIKGRQDANSVVVVITDGRPLSPVNTGKASEELKKISRLIWMPVGQGVKSSIENMKKWSSQPWENNLLEIDTFAALDTPGTINNMIAEFCPDIK